MDLDLLATFLEIYRRGSLTAAATARGISQPAVSGQLARLEEQLGDVLFTRSRNGAHPTARAHELARRTGPHLDGLRHALAEDADGQACQGTVRLGAAGEFAAARLLPALAPLTRRGLHLRITLDLAEPLLASLADGELDLVVSSIRPPAKLRGLTAIPYLDEEFVLVGTPTAARSIDPQRLAEDPVAALAHLPLVSYAEELPIIRRYWRSEFDRRPPNPVSVLVPDLRAVLAAVIADAGISVLPRYLAEPALHSGSLEQLHRTEVPPLNTLYLVTRSGPAQPAVQLVHRRLLDHATTWGPL
ncbi:LysR family transcriptional regulator [Streptomyces hygroscopicus]|uniref:LysR family transcriptional regulator n=1 Tax=Streptomyces hygroscopicus TaxID=1912 RepID=UPI0008378650|nr:LysR family transcriptional regulator [Streptomyces hygroscopicus]